MDTDSIYLASASDDLRDMVRTELVEEWDRRLMGYHEVPSEHLTPGVGVSFLPRQCCEHDRNLDLKTPLYFKQEFFGNGIIALGRVVLNFAVVFAFKKVACRSVSLFFIIFFRPLTRCRFENDCGPTR